jgi:RimJ/RimL family protein N-acetyltransferase
VGLAHRYRSERLTLRPVAASDEAAVVAAIDDIDVAGWLAVVPHPYSAADFRYFLNEIALAGQTFVIEDAEGFAGIVALQDAVLGYWLSPRAHGRGYATEAAYCLVAAHFAAGGDSLESGYFEGNARSARVLAKLGFVETGRDQKFCKALNAVRPHVIVALSRAAFV